MILLQHFSAECMDFTKMSLVGNVFDAKGDDTNAFLNKNYVAIEKKSLILPLPPVQYLIITNTVKLGN